jgi:hypothetical protein
VATTTPFQRLRWAVLLLIPDLSMEIHGSVRIADAQQSDPGTNGRGEIVTSKACARVWVD